MSVVCDAKRFRSADLQAFEPHVGQAEEMSLLSSASPKILKGLERCDYAVTIGRDGIPVACMGLLPIWRGRAIAWAVIAQDIGVAGLKHLCRIAANGLREAQSGLAYRRVETTVRSDFENGIQMAMMLGFGIDGEMPYYSPEGKNYLLMSRIGCERY